MWKIKVVVDSSGSYKKFIAISLCTSYIKSAPKHLHMNFKMFVWGSTTNGMNQR
jgi:hypothetical protein